MSIYPEILVGASVARAIIADRFPHYRVDVRGDDQPPRSRTYDPIGLIAETGSDQWRVVCMALPEGINVGPHGRYGFSIPSWAADQRIPGYTMVNYPRTPLTEDQDTFRDELAAVLIPVVESALAAIDAERDALTKRDAS